MLAFHSVLPEIAEPETRWIGFSAEPGRTAPGDLPTDDYAFVEMYCEDLGCDCRRGCIQVWGRNQAGVLALINCGWEDRAFYAKNPTFEAEDVRDIVKGSLDPINPQSKYAPALLRLFQEYVFDEAYRQRLRRHHELFRAELQRRNKGGSEPGKGAGAAPPIAAKGDRIPPQNRERFAEVSALIEQFGERHLDEELTAYCIELWRRLCRKKSQDCRLGKASVWAASVVHVISRINFLFDKNQPVHLSFDTVCDFFEANKTTVGAKATQIERNLRLRAHTEPGLCRRGILEQFTFLTNPRGISVPFAMAKELGLIPPDSTVEDFY